MQNLNRVRSLSNSTTHALNMARIVQITLIKVNGDDIVKKKNPKHNHFLPYSFERGFRTGDDTFFTGICGS